MLIFVVCIAARDHADVCGHNTILETVWTPVPLLTLKGKKATFAVCQGLQTHN